MSVSVVWTSEICVNILSPFHFCVRLSLTGEDEVQQDSRLHAVKRQTQVVKTKKGEMRENLGRKPVEGNKKAWFGWSGLHGNFGPFAIKFHGRGTQVYFHM